MAVVLGKFWVMASDSVGKDEVGQVTVGSVRYSEERRGGLEV